MESNGETFMRGCWGPNLPPQLLWDRVARSAFMRGTQMNSVFVVQEFEVE